MLLIDFDFEYIKYIFALGILEIYPDIEPVKQ